MYRAARLALRLTTGAVVALFGTVGVGPSSSFADDAWRFRIFTKLTQIQSRQNCFVTPKTNRYVHILGVQPGNITLGGERQAYLINALNETILSNTSNRVTVARQFQSIATRSTSMSEARIREIQALASEAEVADITVLLQPLRLTGNHLNLQVTIWVTDHERTGDNKISCVTPFSTSVTFEDEEDPRCAKAWRQADLRDDIAGYQGFRDFFPDCVEAGEARKRIAAKRNAEHAQQKAKRCKGAFALAQATGSLRAYQDFIGKFHDCPEAVGARVAMDVLKRANKQPEGPPKPKAEGQEEQRQALRPTSPRQRCVQNVGIGLYCASSVLPTRGVNKRYYGPKSLFDGSDKTAWVEGRDGYGEGEWLMIAFDSRTAIAGLFLKNGYPRKPGHFARNSAVRKVEVRLSNGKAYTFPIANHPRAQWIKFPSARVDWVQMIIREVRHGSRWADTAINEFGPVMR